MPTLLPPASATAYLSNLLESDENELSYYSFTFFKMAAAAILHLMMGDI
jgi:hypothetical protein